MRQQLDAEYRFPTAVGRVVSSATSVEDDKLRNVHTIVESLEIKLSTCDLNDTDLTKFDDEVQMGFDVQLLTPDLLEQHPHLDPTQRSVKVGCPSSMRNNERASLAVLSNAQSATRSMPTDQQCRCVQDDGNSSRLGHRCEQTEESVRTDGFRGGCTAQPSIAGTVGNRAERSIDSRCRRK